MSDEATEFAILDRGSFQRFLGIEHEGRVPDRTSIWTFKETLGDSGVEKLFAAFDGALATAGLTGTKGRIVDASFVEVPRQRNTREENQRIKSGEGAPEDWDENKKRQKDVDARWTKKNNVTFYGYKNHVKVNRKTKLIETFKVTDAKDHDSTVLLDLLGEGDGVLWADSAYKSAEFDAELKRRGIRNRIHEKGKRNAPLTEAQIESNRIKSKVRARVEHVFGAMAGRMGGDRIRTIGMERAKRGIGLINLVYNFIRASQIARSGLRFAC